MAQSVSATVRADGGYGGYSDLGQSGDGGDAMALVDLRATVATSAAVNATAVGGGTDYYYYDSPMEGVDGNAVARATLTMEATEPAYGTASAYAYSGGNYYYYNDTGLGGHTADAFASVEGADSGNANALSQSNDDNNQYAQSTASAPVGGPARAMTHSGVETPVTPGAYDLLAGNVFASSVLNPASPDFGTTTTYGYGVFAAAYGGEGEFLTYFGSSSFAFDALTGDGIYLDFLTNDSLLGAFESLSLTVSLGNYGTVLSQLFTSTLDFQTFLAGDYFLGNAMDGIDFVTLSYNFASSGADSGLGFDFRLANGPGEPPVPPVPLPAGGWLMLSALAALLAATRKRRRPHQCDMIAAAA